MSAVTVSFDEEDRRGDTHRAARRGGVRACWDRALREDGVPGGLPQRRLCKEAQRFGSFFPEDVLEYYQRIDGVTAVAVVEIRAVGASGMG